MHQIAQPFVFNTSINLEKCTSCSSNSCETHTQTCTHKYTCSVECANFTTRPSMHIHFQNSSWICTNLIHTHTHTYCAVGCTREYDDLVMTPQHLTILSHSSCLFSALLLASLAVHITLPDSRGGQKKGMRKEERGVERLEGEGWEIEGEWEWHGSLWVRSNSSE